MKTSSHDTGNDTAVHECICYVIPVFNNQSGLIRSITSIREDEPNIQIIVYDDGSEPPVEVPTEISGVTVLRTNRNLGIGSGLNKLLASAREKGYKYAALIDAGDLVKPGRIKKQIQMLSDNPTASVLGGGMDMRTLDGRLLGQFIPPTTQTEIAKAFKRGYPFVHPTAAFNLANLAALNIQYPTGVDSCVDLAMLYKLHKAGGVIINTSDILIDYIRESESIGVKRASNQAKNTLAIRLKYADIYDIDSILGVLDPRQWIRLVSPRAFYRISNALRKMKEK